MNAVSEQKEIFSNTSSDKNELGIVSTRQIVSEFMQSYNQVLEDYSKDNFTHDARKSKVYSFQDKEGETSAK